jgi:hypothetical protein
MLSFTVHEPPNPPADRVDRAESLVFIKDGFSWAAALFAPLWLLVHRLWWPLLGYVLLTGALQLLQLTGLDPRWLGLAGIAINLLIGFEADTLRRWALDQRGWHTVGSVTGRSTAECERRFFETWLPSQPIIAPATSSSALIPPPRRGWPGFGALMGVRP